MNNSFGGEGSEKMMQSKMCRNVKEKIQKRPTRANTSSPLLLSDLFSIR